VQRFRGSGAEYLKSKFDIPALVTGSIVVNGTIENILKVRKPLIFFGTTAAGTAKLMGWERFCPCSY